MIKDYLPAAVFQFCLSPIFFFLFIQSGKNTVCSYPDHDEAGIHASQILDRRNEKKESREKRNKLSSIQSTILHLKYRECQNNRNSDHA